VLDLIAAPLRGRDDNESELPRIIAEILSEMLVRYWKLSLKAVRVVPTSNGLTIQALDYTYPIEQVVREALSSRTQTLSLSSRKSRKFRSFQGEFSGLFLSLAVGEHSSIEQGTFPQEHLERSTIELSKDYSRYFEGLAPDFPVTAVPELYLDGVTYPPLGVDEIFSGLRGVTQILEKGREFRLKQEKIDQISELFLLSPDEQLAALGFVLSGIFEAFDDKLIARSERFGRYTGMLRQTVTYLRKEIVKESDWLIKEEIGEKEKLRIAFEKKLGLIPWIFLSPNEIAQSWSEKRFRKLAESLIFFDFDYAFGLIETLSVEDPRNFSLRKQGIYLALLGRKLEEAKKLIQALASEPECEHDAKLHWLWATHALSTNDLPSARRYADLAIKFLKPEDDFAGNLINDYGWILIQSGEFEGAVTAFDESIRLGGSRLTALLNKALALKSLGWTEMIEDIKREVAALSPSDPRAVRLFFS